MEAATAMPSAAGTVLIDDPDQGVFRVHRSAMAAPEIFEQEMRRIFDRVWIYLGHESEVPAPGDFRTRTMAGQPLILCRRASSSKSYALSMRHGHHHPHDVE